MSYSGEYNGIAKSAYGYSMLTNLCGAPKYPLGVQNVAPVYQVMGIDPRIQNSVAYAGMSYAKYTPAFPKSTGGYGSHPESPFAYAGASGGTNAQATTSFVSRTAQ
jgi:hypothetical protein